jgi:capsular exopolysaccharide synthesis family protein
VELSDYVRILRGRWKGALVLTLVGLVAAGAFSLTQPAVYAANANGFVTTGENSNSALASVSDSVAKSRARSYVDIARSRATAERVIDQLDLKVTPGALIGDISVEQPADTVLLKITARASSPSKAQELADAWVSALAAQIASIENPTGATAPGTTRLLPVESAELPESPVTPNVRLNLMIGLVVGALLGTAYALVRNQLDRRVTVASEVERRFKSSVVGSIPATRGLQRKDDQTTKLAVSGTVDHHGADAAEAFRKLRTNLAFMDVDDPPRVIVVTSPRPGDGKSTVAANLAAAIAVSGQTVTLVDADLRRPNLAARFGLVEGAGLTDVLIGSATVADVRQPHPAVPALTLLAAGGIPPNPSELLGSRAMRHLLEELSTNDMVILDAPPVLPVTDPAVLTRLADGCLLVISHGKTMDTELSDALDTIQAVSGRVLGVIFNRVPRRNDVGGYYGAYYTNTAEQPSSPAPPTAEASPPLVEGSPDARPPLPDR